MPLVNDLATAVVGIDNPTEKNRSGYTPIFGFQGCDNDPVDACLRFANNIVDVTKGGLSSQKGEDG